MKLLTSILRENRKFFHATAILIGTMVGVGIFGIPFVFAKAGFWVGAVFLVFAGLVTTLFNLLLGEIVLRTSQRHQLVGYTDKYLGPFYKRIMFFATAIGVYGAMLAYLIIAGEFLNNIFSHFWYISTVHYSFLFWVCVSVLVGLGLRNTEKVEFGMALLYGFVMVVIFIVGVRHVSLTNLQGFNPPFWFLPYGVLLFAFAGMSAIPLQRQILAGQEQKLKKAIILAVSLVGVLYALFAFVVVGISGEVTTPDALSGLFEALGSTIIFLGSLFGILAIGTTYSMQGIALREVFQWDYRIKPWVSWLLVAIPPAVLFWGGLRNFIDVISLVGAVAIGVQSVVLIFIYRRAQMRGERAPEFTVRIPWLLLYALVPVFLAGVIYTLFFS